MVYSLLLIACSFIVPLAVQHRQRGPAVLFIATAIVYAVFGAISLIKTPAFISTTEGALLRDHGSFYVRNAGLVEANGAMIMGVGGALLWLQTRWGAMLYPRMTKALFWLLHIGIIAVAAPTILATSDISAFQIYADYLDVLYPASRHAIVPTFFAALALVALSIWSALLRSKQAWSTR